MPVFPVFAIAVVWGAVSLALAGFVSGGYRDRRRFRKPRDGQNVQDGQDAPGGAQDAQVAGTRRRDATRDPSVGSAVPSYGEGLARQRGEGRTPAQRRAGQVVLVVTALALAGFGVLAHRSGTPGPGVFACFAVAAMMVFAWTRRLAR